MEPLDLTGKFWFPGSDTAAQYGRLIFDFAEGSSLILANRLARITPDGVLEAAFGGIRERIFGVVSQEGREVEVTLINSVQLSWTGYTPNLVLTGGHFAVDDTFFEEAVIRFRDLPAWVSTGMLNVKVNSDPGADRRELEVQLERPQSQHASFTNGRISLDFRWSHKIRPFEQLSVQQLPQIELHYTEPTDLSDIIASASDLSALLTLCTDSLGTIRSIDLYRSDVPELLLSGQPIPDSKKKIQLYAKLWGTDQDTGNRAAVSHQALISFEDAGGIETCARWLDAAPNLRIVIGSLLTMRADNMFGENRFVNVSSAAEGFHRSTIGGLYMDKQEWKTLKRGLRQHLPEEHHQWFDDCMRHSNAPSLNRRLRQLAEQLDPVTEALVGDVHIWASVVSQCRNELVHLEGERDVYDGADLHWLAESVFNVTRLCMLLYVGVNHELVPSLVQSWPIKSSADYARRAISNLSQVQEARK
ncbi:HEPN domain-containing protein [Sphaerisporangium sp. NPDC051017]|uniref:ApeA N-terminal domain 1-containing protein n=1 Tax=Sphaerisporangium sp. NPDC051017 TaxID=3154636 RepID=UPI00342E4748